MVWDFGFQFVQFESGSFANEKTKDLNTFDPFNSESFFRPCNFFY